MGGLGDRRSGAEGASVAHDPDWPLFGHALNEHGSDLPDEKPDVIARRKQDLVSYVHDKTGENRAETERVLDGISRDTGFRRR